MTMTWLRVPDPLSRIYIICVEDCIMHPDLPAVTWLMLAASKGFRVCMKLDFPAVYMHSITEYHSQINI